LSSASLQDVAHAIHKTPSTALICSANLDFHPRQYQPDQLVSTTLNNDDSIASYGLIQSCDSVDTKSNNTGSMGKAKCTDDHHDTSNFNIISNSNSNSDINGNINVNINNNADVDVESVVTAVDIGDDDIMNGSIDDMNDEERQEQLTLLMREHQQQLSALNSITAPLEHDSEQDVMMAGSLTISGCDDCVQTQTADDVMEGDIINSNDKNKNTSGNEFQDAENDEDDDVDGDASEDEEDEDDDNDEGQDEIQHDRDIDDAEI
jgi:hypothetical protein